jgi:hypothetical protein
MSKRKATYGTKSYATKILLQNLRAYAAATRGSAFVKFSDPGKWSAESKEHTKHGEALGTIVALYSTGCITHAQYDRAFERLKQVHHAKVTRRPFVEMRRAA